MESKHCPNCGKPVKFERKEDELLIFSCVEHGEIKGVKTVT